jgi:hypothetical protein
MKRHIRVLVAIAVGLTALSAEARAQPPAQEHDVSQLARTTQNPVGDLTTLPFQFNFNTGGDLEERTFFNLNFQPVIPFKLSEDWSVIARTIIPISSFPGPGGTRYSGLGDLQQQVFVTPSRPWGNHLGSRPDVLVAHGDRQRVRNRDMGGRRFCRRTEDDRALGIGCARQPGVAHGR